MVDERTMLRATFDRVRGIADIIDPIVVCNADHHQLVTAELAAAGYDPKRVILEPVGRNTAPAVAAAATVVLEAEDATLLVLPADHLIRDEPAFREVVASGAGHAASGRLVTFGIVPDYPETGFGYIKVGEAIDATASTIARFVEKPDLATARGYLAEGGYLWNSGIFMFLASRYLEELERLQPLMVKATAHAVEDAERHSGVRLDAASFAACPSDSVDFAVMEHTRDGVVIPLAAGWSDVGSWAALWEIAPQDEHGNVAVGDVVSIDSQRSYLRSESRLVTAIGIEDMIVVETADAVLVAPRGRAQDVKRMVDDLMEADRVEADRHPRRATAFGTVEDLEATAGFRVRKLTIVGGREMAHGRHLHRAERWIVAQGTGVSLVGDERQRLMAGDTVFIAPGTPHSIENDGADSLELIEVQLGASLADEDTKHDQARGVDS